MNGPPGMRPQNRYWQKAHTKLPPFDLRRLMSGRYIYSCPGYIGHMAKRKHKPVAFFEHWHRRGEYRHGKFNKAYGLYWRSHPEER